MRWWFLLSLCFAAASSSAQHFLVIVPDKSTPPESKKAFEKITYPGKFPDTLTRAQYLLTFMQILQEEGFLAAVNDSSRQSGDTLRAYFRPGQRYYWINLEMTDPGGIAEAAGYREKNYKGKPVHYSRLKSLKSGIIRYCEENGYPFASVKLEHIVIGDDHIGAHVAIDKGPLVYFDSLTIHGSSRISPQYLQQYLGIRPGAVYQESKIKQAGQRLKNLQFLTVKREHLLLFSQDKARLNLYLAPRKASRFDGFIGLLPRSDITNRAQLNGELNLSLNNALGQGEMMAVQWKKPSSLTQDLRLKFNYPYLFTTPFGTEGEFNLFKRDTTFIELQLNGGFQYLLEGGNFVGMFVSYRNLSLISTRGMEQLTSTPLMADVTSLLYHIGSRYERLDYRFNPRRGFAVEATAGAGTKKVARNPVVNDSLYKGVDLSSILAHAEYNAEFFFSPGGPHVINFGFRGACRSGKDFFVNELFRIGGLRSLRGFDEASIFVSSFQMIKAEYRFILEQNSYLSAFFNGAWGEARTIKGYESDWPYGFGAGITTETRAGIFALSYALGTRMGNPLLLKGSKIHFGLISFF